MGLVIPFANMIGPNSGTASDGVIYGVLAQVAPITALSMVHLAPFTKVFRGNANAQSALTWEEVTVAANNDIAGDVALFDTVNPTADRLCIELSEGDEVEGISFLVSASGTFTGTPAADVYYRTADLQVPWRSVTSIVTPDLTGAGLRKITFTPIKYSDIAALMQFWTLKRSALIPCWLPRHQCPRPLSNTPSKRPYPRLRSCDSRWGRVT